MAYIPIMVKVVDAVCDGQIDVDEPGHIFGKITSCCVCGGILFYQQVTLMEGTKHATDTDIYCAVCGQMQGGYSDDPFNELSDSSVSTLKKSYKEERHNDK